MNVEKAIKILRDTGVGTKLDYRYSAETLNAVKKTAIQALEKQTPKPPEYKVHPKYKALGKNYYCSCGVMFVDFERNGTNYCGNCGQKLREVHNEL